MTSASNNLVDRELRRVVVAAMAEEPVIMLHGPRSVGKSTLLASICALCDGELLDLDDLDTRAAVNGGPDFAVGGERPVFIDEYQKVPQVLDAIKAQLNRDFRPGRFVLTGSTSYATLPRTAQSLTGRARIIDVAPLSQHELSATRPRSPFVTRLLEDPAAAIHGPPGRADRLEYANRALAGGLPIALQRRPETRARWFSTYLTQVLDRDVLDIREIRQRDRLPRLLRRLVAQTGQILNVAQAARSEGLEYSVAADYVQLLEAVLLIHRLPAWGTTLGSRVNKLPKLHVADTGLGGWLLGLSIEAVRDRQPSALTELGHLLETFTVNELLAQLGWHDTYVEAGHYRTHDGHEVDLVFQLPGGDVVAVEVKAGELVSTTDIAQLTRLRSILGDRFRGGVILHTGRMAATVDDRIHAAPIERLWTLPS